NRLPTTSARAILGMVPRVRDSAVGRRQSGNRAGSQLDCRERIRPRSILPTTSAWPSTGSGPEGTPRSAKIFSVHAFWAFLNCFHHLAYSYDCRRPNASFPVVRHPAYLGVVLAELGGAAADDGAAAVERQGQAHQVEADLGRRLHHAERRRLGVRLHVREV